MRGSHFVIGVALVLLGVPAGRASDDFGFQVNWTGCG